MRSEFRHILEDRDVINFKSLWLQCDNIEEKEILAIFSFYDICDVPETYLKRMTDAMLYKLKMLSLITFCELFENFPYSEAKSFCMLASDEELEELLVNIGRYVSLKIDDVSGIVHVSNYTRSRDIYTGSDALPLPKPTRRNVKAIICTLKQWRDNLNDA